MYQNHLFKRINTENKRIVTEHVPVIQTKKRPDLILFLYGIRFIWQFSDGVMCLKHSDQIQWGITKVFGLISSSVWILGRVFTWMLYAIFIINPFICYFILSFSNVKYLIEKKKCVYNGVAKEICGHCFFHRLHFYNGWSGGRPETGAKDLSECFEYKVLWN